MIYVGAVSAGDHCDVHVLDSCGAGMATHRLSAGFGGARALHTVLAGLTDDPGHVFVGVVIDRGLWAAALVAAGYQVWVVDPSAIARRRASSAVIDPAILADVVRTDPEALRPITGTGSEAADVQMLGRMHQSLLWSRARHAGALRDLLSAYHPAALETFPDVADRDALAVLGLAPSPDCATRLSVSDITTALKVAGRQRLVADRARRIQATLARPHPTVPDTTAPDATAVAVTAAVRVIAELNTQIEAVQTALTAHVQTHPDAEVYRRLPELRLILAVGILGEFGPATTARRSAVDSAEYR